MGEVKQKSLKREKILNIFLVALLVAEVCCIVFVSVSKKTPSNQPSDVPLAESYLDYRRQISDFAFDITSGGPIEEKDFIAKMNPVIDQTKSTDYYRSIDIYATFLAARHGLVQSALGQFNYYIFQLELTDKESCELYEYRKIIEGGYENNDYSPEANEASRVSYCTVALVDYPQKDGEDTFAYAERLYYEGFITESIRLLESIDPESLTDDDQYRDYYRYILSYYYSTAQYKKYNSVRLGYDKYMTTEEQNE